jgi:uncharacterized membrane protein
MSAYLMGLKMTKTQLGSFLIKRGFWLINVEIVVIAFAVTFSPFYNTIIFQVIWATGISMVILGLLVRLPYTVILIIGCCIVFGHNLLDYPEAAHNQQVGFWWDLIHHGRFTVYTITRNHVLVIAYAFLPWTGIMAVGYCMGKLFEPSVNPLWRRKMLIYIGSGLVMLFFILRSLNHYGNPFPWTEQRDPFYTFLSFLNVNKYPPSLMYVAVTIGPALIFLAFAENLRNKITSIFIIYGRVPFFYYVVHFFIIHALSFIALLLSGLSAKEIWVTSFPFRPAFGYQLWVVHLVWIVVVIIMYPLCKKYNHYKNTHHYWWLSYL